MARDTLAVQSIGAEGAQKIEDVTFTAIVTANGFEVDNSSGKVLILMINGGTSGAQTAVIDSVADPYGREGDLSVAVAQDDYAVAGPFPGALWNNTGGKLHIDSATEDAFSFAAIKLS